MEQTFLEVGTTPSFPLTGNVWYYQVQNVCWALLNNIVIVIGYLNMTNQQKLVGTFFQLRPHQVPSVSKLNITISDYNNFANDVCVSRNATGSNPWPLQQVWNVLITRIFPTVGMEGVPPTRQKFVYFPLPPHTPEKNSPIYQIFIPPIKGSSLH